MSGLRKSARKKPSDIAKEEREKLEMNLAIRDDKALGLEIVQTEIGRGIAVTKNVEKDSFVVEYAGEIVSMQEAKKREDEYEKSGAGCFMFYFWFEGYQYCIDATRETERLGRLVNHSKGGANVKVKVVKIDQLPRLVMYSNQDIPAGSEIFFDYNENRAEVKKSMPWLAN